MWHVVYGKVVIKCETSSKLMGHLHRQNTASLTIKVGMQRPQMTLSLLGKVPTFLLNLKLE